MHSRVLRELLPNQVAWSFLKCHEMYSIFSFFLTLFKVCNILEREFCTQNPVLNVRFKDFWYSKNGNKSNSDLV